MTGNSELTAADRMRRLLASAGIEHILIVDDDFELRFDQLLVPGDQLRQALEVLPGREVNFATPPEDWRGVLQELWSTSTSEERRQIMMTVYSKTDLAPPSITEFDLLTGMIPDDVECHCLTPEYWRANFEGILSDVVSESTMVLFDRRFGESDEDGGLREMQRVLNSGSVPDLRIGVLTNTVSPEHQSERWNDLAKELGTSSNQFMLLSKAHLEEDGSRFCEALRVGLTAPSALSLVECIASTIQSTLGEALQLLRDFNADELDWMVFGRSVEEGVWEIDTLLRLFAILQRQQIRSVLYESQSVISAVEALRGLRVHSVQREIAPQVQARSIYRTELYETADHLAQMHATLELGDVFQKVKGTKQFILCEQPCSLMIRDKGYREPTVQYVTLLPIRNSSPSSDRRGLVLLPGFSETPLDNSYCNAWVEVDRPCQVPIESLEYCVVGSDGLGWAPDTVATRPSLVPNWIIRNASLIEEANVVRSRIKAVSDSAGSRDEKHNVIRSHFGIRKDSKCKPSIRGDNYNLGFKRVGRVQGRLADEILDAYGAHMTRRASELPLADFD